MTEVDERFADDALTENARIDLPMAVQLGFLNLISLWARAFNSQVRGPDVTDQP
jgi:hypothetical protein